MDNTDFNDIRTVIISVVIVLNIVLNVVVVAVLLRYPELREDSTNIFILSLTLSDLAHGCTAMPISAALCSDATPTVRTMIRFLPKIHAFFSALFVIASMHSLCWVTVYKIVAITRPLQCEQILSRQRCYIVLAFSWIFAAVTGVVLTARVDGWNLDTCLHGLPMMSSFDMVIVVLIVLVIGIALPILLKVIATASIFRVIMRTHQQIAEQTRSIAVLPIENQPSITSMSIRSGKNVLIICLTDVILAIPVNVYITGIIVGKDNLFAPYFRFLAAWIFFSTTFVNSFLYITVFSSIRRKTITMFKECTEFIGIL